MSRKPRQLKKKKKTERNNNYPTICSDITVNDFANNEIQTRFRPKKASINTLMNEVKLLQVKEEDKTWDEKDDDELLSDLTEDNFPGQKGEQSRGGERKTNKSDGDEGANYPLDIWFIISEHIAPEDVGRFAAICQATYYITTTAIFWFTLYRRHYKWVSDLPAHLTHWNMNYTKGLRAAVVQSLYFMYSPFSSRLVGEKPLSADPTQLLRSQCVLQWHVKVGTLFKYFFKFAHPKQNKDYIKYNKENNWRKDALVTFNPEDGCYILEATTSSVCGIPMIIGEYLYHAGLGVSTNMCNHRLRLSMVPAHLLSSSTSSNSRKYQVPTTEVILDPVSDVKVYPWWHPRYYKCGFNTNTS
nr:transmembrane protein 183A-like isoform X1 [Procambarus clarkii]XP_045613910.1 transmembrane protein 183A-like isoform X1 [Procambarus clarkii]XP_045613911.1 transmembrane protein 183A-like isoform X1 [Procambarus clarkii]XP_045613912.1 transmembrane protein 183A-like isoform X1 [Procambarus clarkii]XP_045613913.1 transmembrane protein 183A-like isoform X1 [Procambarus clarkii]XP_045613914.1 transmembrane protein 183A-like isoform X1 [Procambarus clarkii]XP_045613915.1 transmembrane protei